MKPKTGKRSPFYGKLFVTELDGEIKTIWYSKHTEPPLCGSLGFYQPTETDPEQFINSDFAMKLWDDTALSWRERSVLIRSIICNDTLRDIGKDFGVSPERINQILRRGLRKLRGQLSLNRRKYV